MSCNLNFNGCRGGRYYPQPISTCQSQLLALLNQGTTTVINPVTSPSWSYSNFVVPQNVWAGSVLGVRQQASSGSGIRDNLDGSFLLSPGTYQIEFNINGVVPLTSGLQVAGVLNGVVIEESRATSNASSGENSDLSGRAVFVVSESNSHFALINTGSENASFNRAALTINKIR